MRTRTIVAIFKRNVASYFSGVLGYLFLVVFVVACAVFAYTPQFFANNLATLDQLNAVFPILLLFIVPAITMATWAEERKLGTQELLFTLPATDWEIVLAKYLAALAVYSIALLFSLVQLVVLEWYGNPDWGVLATTYLGYWLAGAALLSAGMFASALTDSTTVAFVLGVVICAVPVFIGQIAPSHPIVRELSLRDQFSEFTLGVVPLNGVLYFITLTALMLYLNLVWLSRRHWSGSRQTKMELQYLVRTLALIVILASLNFMARAGADALNLRADLTADNVYTLSATTHEALAALDDKHPVTIQAFLSPQVPREYVNLRKRLIGLLRQYDRLGGSHVQVRFVDVAPYSDQADEAEKYGVERRDVQTERDGKMQVDELYMGIVVTSPRDEVVVASLDNQSPLEYELTQAVRTVTGEKRKTIGVLTTDANILGGTDSQLRQQRAWQIVSELKKLHNVEQVEWKEQPGAPSPAAPKLYEPIDPKKYDVLLALLPSSLNDGQMARLVEYVGSGRPVLILDDPFPAFNLSLAPRVPKADPMHGMFGRPPMPTDQKADGGHATPLLRALGVEWNYDEVVWDNYAAHPEFSDILRKETLFVNRQNGTKDALNTASPVTSGLGEVLAFFSGSVTADPFHARPDLKFTPLLQTSPSSGQYVAFENNGPFGQLGVNERPLHTISGPLVLAARIEPKEGKKGPNVVYVADIDLVADHVLNAARYSLNNLKLDNLRFFLNCIDLLAGDEGNLALRNRRDEPRTLVEIQKKVNVYREQRQKQESAYEKQAREELDKLQAQLDAAKKKIEGSDLNVFQKGQEFFTAVADSTRKFAEEQTRIEEEKQRKINKLKAEEQRNVEALQNRIRWQAVLLPPLAPILLGVFLLGFQSFSERRGIEPIRKVKR